MHVEVKEQLLGIITFKSLKYMNISLWKGCVNIPDRTFLNRMLLRRNEHNNESGLRVCNHNLTSEM